MPRSEIAEANAIVAAVTHLLDLVHEADEDEVLLRIYESEEAFRLAHPEAVAADNRLQARIARTAARAAWRLGYDIAVVRLRAAPLRTWLTQQGGAAEVANYAGEPSDMFSGDAALRALGLNPAELKAAPRKPAQGPTLAARIARWATDPEAEEDAILELAEELLAQHLDGALGVVERMLEPEDFAYARHEIDIIASACMVGEKGREREAMLFVSPVLRDGEDARPAALPAGLQGRLTGIALDPSFVELILAPFWIPTAALSRLKPSELRETAEAMANGLEPPIPPAAPGDRDVCLLGLTLPMADGADDRDEDEEDDEEAQDRLDAWLAVLADAAGGGEAEPPISLARALDLLRRVRLAVPDEAGMEEDEEEEDEEEGAYEASEALLDALLDHLRAMRQGHVLLTGADDGAVALRIVAGEPEIEAGALRDLLADAAAEGGVLFIVPAATPGAGHAFLLEAGEAEGLSAGAAAEAFAAEAPSDWAAAPGAWVDAPALDYDPSA